MPSSIGTQLKEVRLQRGLSLEEVAHATRISPAQLESLELDDYTNFASPAYARGFLKNYSEYLGIDAWEQLEALARAPSVPSLKGSNRPPIQFTPSDSVIPVIKNLSEPLPARSFMVPLLFFILALAVPAFFLFGKRVAFEEAKGSRSQSGPIVVESLPSGGEVILKQRVATPAAERRYPSAPTSPPEPSPELDALLGVKGRPETPASGN